MSSSLVSGGSIPAQIDLWLYFVYLCIGHLQGWRCWQRWQGLTARDRLPEISSFPGNLRPPELPLWKEYRRLQRWLALCKYSPGTHKRSKAEHDNAKGGSGRSDNKNTLSFQSQQSQWTMSLSFVIFQLFHKWSRRMLLFKQQLKFKRATAIKEGDVLFDDIVRH